MTTQLPPGYRILSSAWLAENFAPEDLIYWAGSLAEWEKSVHRGRIIPRFERNEYIYASADQSLPAEAWADSPTAQYSYDVHLQEARDALAAMTKERDRLLNQMLKPRVCDQEEINRLTAELDAVRDSRSCIIRQRDTAQARCASLEEELSKLKSQHIGNYGHTN